MKTYRVTAWNQTVIVTAVDVVEAVRTVHPYTDTVSVEPAKFRVELDVSGLRGQEWDDWCDESINDPRIEHRGMHSKGIEVWYVISDTEEEATKLVEYYLKPNVSIICLYAD